jgi:hypothetical protein
MKKFQIVSLVLALFFAVSLTAGDKKDSCKKACNKERDTCNRTKTHPLAKGSPERIKQNKECEDAEKSCKTACPAK